MQLVNVTSSTNFANVNNNGNANYNSASNSNGVRPIFRHRPMCRVIRDDATRKGSCILPEGE